MRLLGNLYNQIGEYGQAAEIWREYGRLAFQDPRGRRELLRSLLLGGITRRSSPKG